MWPWKGWFKNSNNDQMMEVLLSLIAFEVIIPLLMGYFAKMYFESKGDNYEEQIKNAFRLVGNTIVDMKW